MTPLDFHTGVADKLTYACRLVRKARQSGHRVVVTGAADQLTRLDALLWTFDAREFLPHARLLAGQPMPPDLARTPVWLADSPDDAALGATAAAVLINLGPEAAAGWQAYARLIEVVAVTVDEIASGRQRWRQYLAAGANPINHSRGVG